MYINILRLLSFFALGAKVATANIEKIEIRGTHYVFADTGEGDEEKCQGECTEDQFCAPLINKCLDKQKTFIIGVSVVAGLILIVCCCCCCCCCHKHRKKKRMNSKKYSEVELSSSSTSSYTSSTSSYSSYSSYNSYSSSATQRSYSPSTPSYSTNTSSSSTNLTDTPFGKQLLEEVKKLDNAVDIALLKMATNSLSLEDGQKLIAAELLKSLLNVEPSDGDELELAFAVFIWYLDKKLQDRIPGMSESSRKSFVTGVVEQMASLVSQMKNAKTLDDALELIKAAVIVAWSNVVNGSISVEEATLIGASIAAALISCKIRSTQELTAHMAGFTAWMYALADRVAPGLTSHQKDLIISESWKKAVELIAS